MEQYLVRKFNKSVLLNHPLKNSLTWDDYPSPRPLFHRDKWHVSVSIPNTLRIYYGKGGGNNKRYVAGLHKSDYDSKKKSLSYKAYTEFDDLQRQILEAPKKSQAVLDLLWEQQGHIASGEKTFNINDAVMKMISVFKEDVIPRGADHFFFEDIDETKFADFKGQKTTKPLTSNIPYQDLQDVVNDMNATAKRAKRNPTRYTKDEILACKNYLTPAVRSWLEDLLVITARKDNAQSPTFPKPVLDDFWQNGIEWDEDEIDQREVKPETLSSLRDHFFNSAFKIYNKMDTRNKIRQGYDSFINHMGDLDPKEIDKPLVSQWFTKIVDKKPKTATKTLTSRLFGMKRFQDFAIENRYMTAEPFSGISMARRGVPSKKWLEYTDNDLDVIFNYDWGEQERLLLSLGLATGMRIGEIARLEWEQVLQNNRCSFIVLIPSEDSPDQDYYEKQIEVSVKNEGSKRVVPLHPSLRLNKPINATGRIFNYSISGYDEVTKSSGKSVNPILSDLVPHSRKAFHSFRSTLTIKLNRTGMGDRSKFVTGHSLKSVQGDHYDGMEINERFEWISKMDLERWLNPKR